MDTVIMARKKAKSPAGGPQAKETFTIVRSQSAWKAWLTRFAEFRRLTVADVIDQALVSHARETGFAELPPKR